MRKLIAQKHLALDVANYIPTLFRSRWINLVRMYMWLCRV